MWVADRGLGAGRTSVGATGGAVLRGLPCWAASSLAVGPWVCVKWTGGLLSGFHHTLHYWQVWGADVGPGERPLVPGRLRAAVTCHEAGLWPLIAMLIPPNRLLLVPVSMFSVSVRRRRRARPQSVPVDPAGLLAPGLLLRPSLNSVMRGTGCVLTLAGVT